MHVLIVHVKQWSCFVVRNPNSLLPTCGHDITARTLLHLRSDARTSLAIPDANTGGGRSAAEVDEHVGWFPAESSRRNN